MSMNDYWPTDINMTYKNKTQHLLFWHSRDHHKLPFIELVPYKVSMVNLLWAVYKGEFQRLLNGSTQQYILYVTT